jgi:hypothetical protein
LYTPPKPFTYIDAKALCAFSEGATLALMSNESTTRKKHERSLKACLGMLLQLSGQRRVLELSQRMTGLM